MQGPFSGIRIVDLTTVISGPLATMVMADQGADVIKVESSNGGDYARQLATRRGGFSASFLNNNRNKRSVVLDLKSAIGLSALRQLIQKADVFVQNFRPGVADRLGLSEADLREIKPDLIYVSISGFGFEGPMAGKPVYDPLVQALSSLTTVQAGSDDVRPKLIRTILPDKLTGIQASQAIAAALFARERTGEGQHIRLSMLDTIISFLWSSDMGGHTFIGDESEKEETQSFVDLIYEVADGYVSVAVMQDKHWKGFSTAVERPDLSEMEEFSTAELREINRDARLAATQEALRSFSVDDILERLDREGVPCAPVLTRTQMRHHPQVLTNKIIVESTHPFAGKLRQARQPAIFSKTQTSEYRGAPKLGEHTREVLAEAGLHSSLIDAVVNAQNKKI